MPAYSFIVSLIEMLFILKIRIWNFLVHYTYPILMLA